jgi:hypothetical protein
MGAWGDALFQSDSDLDIIGNLGDALELELYCPDDPAHVRDELDAGKLRATFKRLRGDLAADAYGADAAYVLVLLAAAGMQVGARIPRAYRTFLRAAAPCLHGARARADLLRALDEYEDGVPYPIMGKGLLQTMNEAPASAAPHGMNMMVGSTMGGVSALVQTHASLAPVLIHFLPAVRRQHEDPRHGGP